MTSRPVADALRLAIQITQTQGREIDSFILSKRDMDRLSAEMPPLMRTSSLSKFPDTPTFMAIPLRIAEFGGYALLQGSGTPLLDLIFPLWSPPA